MFFLYFYLDANIGNKKSYRNYVVVQGGLSSVVSSTRILWHKDLEWTTNSTNISIPSLSYAIHMDINLPAWQHAVGVDFMVWWWWECWDDRLWNWRNIQKAASSAIHLIPASVFGSVGWESWSSLSVQCNWLTYVGYDAGCLEESTWSIPYRFGVCQSFRSFPPLFI